MATVFLAAGKFGKAGIESDVFQVMIGISIFVNVWVDIASLIETRWILQKAEGKRFSTLAGLLVLDVAFSGLLFLIPFYLILSMQKGGSIPMYVFVSPEARYSHFQVMFISTFFTSAIFYMFMVTALFAWTLGLARSRLLILIERLESSNHLFKSIGGFIAAVLGVATGIYEIL